MEAEALERLGLHVVAHGPDRLIAAGYWNAGNATPEGALRETYLLALVTAVGVGLVETLAAPPTSHALVASTITLMRHVRCGRFTVTATALDVSLQQLVVQVDVERVDGRLVARSLLTHARRVEEAAR